MARAFAWKWLVVTVAIGVTTAAQVAGCGSDPTVTDNPDNGDAGDEVGPPPDFGNTDGATTQFASIVISPADAVITVDLDQKTPTTDFTAKGIRADGTEVAIPSGAWNFNRIDAAAFEANKLVPTGFIGGKGEVTFKFNGQGAKTTATLKLRVRAGTTPDAAILAKLAAATTPDPAMALLYPYDGTVFPRGLPSPVIQWNGGGAADLYKIEAQSESFDYVEYATVPPPSRHNLPTVPASIWSKLTDSTAGDVAFSVQRYDGVNAYVAKKQKWTIAPANLKGTIYYTQLGGSTRVQKIKPGQTTQDAVVPSTNTCVACHSVSKDGRRIVASLDGGESPWAVYDAETGAELYRSTQPSGFQAISPTGSHVLWRHWNNGAFGSEGQLRLSTSTSDAVLATLVPGVAGAFPGHPVWSPDGKKIAFSMRTAGDGLNITASTVWITDVNLAASPPTFTGTKKIIDPNPTYAVVTYPTFSPDSAWIGFMRANQSRSDGAGAGELWISTADGATQIRLDRADGVPDVSMTPNVSWGPSFHPVAAGGYFWLAFFTERPYGNTFNGTNKQIWLAAVDASPKAGKDPSHPAIYITGQDTTTTNERPQFTVDPCKPLGQSCENGYDCCDGYCRMGDGGLVCQNKGNECSQSGDACKVDADCCTGLKCIGGFCTTPPPN
ncbi:MAG: PD40 domain-containing protein [Labilithrix sp.]|nr:PD40 domain-containing protein [Labilithrix sp.]